MHRTDRQFEGESTYIHCFIAFIESKYKAEWYKWQQDLGRSVVRSISLCNWVKAHHKWSEEKESDYDGDEKCKKSGMPTKPSGSNLHIPFGELWLFFSVSSWQSPTASLSSVFAPVLQEYLLCCFFSCVWTPLYCFCSSMLCAVLNQSPDPQALCTVSNVAVIQTETGQPFRFVLTLAI